MVRECAKYNTHKIKAGYGVGMCKVQLDDVQD